MPTPTRLPQLLDLRQLADHLGVNERHVRRLVAERRIPFIKWGRLLRFDPDAIAEWIDRARVDGDTVAVDRGARLASKVSNARRK